MGKKPTTIMLKFKPTFPTNLRLAIIDFGFEFQSLKKDKWVIYTKKIMTESAEKAPEKPPELKEVLGAPWELDLEQRMTKIIDSYLDPYSHLGAIKARLIAMSRMFPKEQEKWCLEWMEKNLDSEFFAPPWEDPNYEPNLGAC